MRIETPPQPHHTMSPPPTPPPTPPPPIPLSRESSTSWTYFPYVPNLSSSDLFDGHLAKVYSNWSNGITTLIKENEKTFLNQLSQNDTLISLLTTFLRDFKRGPGTTPDPAENDLVKRVLSVYLRLAEITRSRTAKTQEVSDATLPEDATLDAVFSADKLTSVGALMDLASIYISPSDADVTTAETRVAEILQTLFERRPDERASLRSSVSVIVEFLTDLASTYEGRIATRLDGTSSTVQIDETRGCATALMDVTRHMACFFRCCPIAARMSEDPEKVDAIGVSDVLRALQETYAITTRGLLEDLKRASRADAAQTLQDDAEQTSREDSERTRDADEETLNDASRSRTRTRSGVGDFKPQALVKHIKYQILTSAYYILEGRYFAPIETSPKNDAESTATTVTRMCDEILWLMEHGQSERHCQFLSDAPLVLDLEIEWSLSSKLRALNQALPDGEDARVDLVISSLEQLREPHRGTKGVRESIREMKHISSTKEREFYDAETGSQSVEVISSAEDEERYVHRTSLISQVQDLFPDLGEGFVEACLIRFGEEPETVIMKLLEGDLPSDVAALDRSLPRAPMKLDRVDRGLTDDMKALTIVNAPGVLKTRRNVFDGDEFDLFDKDASKVDAGRINLGKRDQGTAERLLDDKSFVAEQKEAILDAEYDDEYDDTYDTNDVLMGQVDLRAVEEGGAEASKVAPESSAETLEQTVESSDPTLRCEGDLVRTFLKTPNVFLRRADVRKSRDRAELKKRTGLADEVLEGWYIMFLRNPRKDRIIRKHTEDAKISQNVLPRTSYRNGRPGENDEDDDEEEEESEGRGGGARDTTQRPPGAHRGGGGGGGRGRGRGAGGGTAPSARSRASDEKNKSNRANHSRKNRRGKKMSGTMGGGPPD